MNNFLGDSNQKDHPLLRLKSPEAHLNQSHQNILSPTQIYPNLSKPKLEMIPESARGGSAVPGAATYRHKKGPMKRSSGQATEASTNVIRNLGVRNSSVSPSKVMSGRTQSTSAARISQSHATAADPKGMGHISPELAAKIVKHYILPMFESDGKKRLKKQYNRMQGMAKSHAKQFKIPSSGEKSGSVYGELKLSEQLHNELDVIRFQVDSLKEELEDSLYEKDSMQKQLSELQQTFQM
jgi:hypothetical protein